VTAARLYTVTVLAILLAACAGAPPKPSIAPAADRFEFSGRIGVKYDGKSFSGNMRWRHVGAHDEIQLYSPLGQTVASLRSDPGYAELLTSDKQRYAAPDAEQVLQQVLGWHLPLAGLPYWVVGEVAPQLLPLKIEFNEQQRLGELEQGVWRVTFTRYAEPAQGGMPDRLTMKYGDIEIKLVIDAWNGVAQEGAAPVVELPAGELP
jgi:outer membrane lipoprotein LolB